MRLSVVEFLKTRRDTVMLMPENVDPKKSIYYTGAMVLQLIQRSGNISVFNLYSEVKSQYGISFPVMLLSLDWLYLIGAVKVTKGGEVKLCI